MISDSFSLLPSAYTHRYLQLLMPQDRTGQKVELKGTIAHGCITATHKWMLLEILIKFS